MDMRAKIFAAALVGVAALRAGQPLMAQTLSLADVARQEEERRKTIKKPAKVITNSDLRNAPTVIPAAAGAAPALPPADSTPVVSASSGGAGSGGGEKPKDQAYWSGRVKTLQGQLERDQSYAVALESRINALTTQYVNQSDPIQQAAAATDRQNALAEKTRLTKQIEDDKKAITDLQEEARRAGVPPGWLR
jgi:hypothetical protein